MSTPRDHELLRAGLVGPHVDLYHTNPEFKMLIDSVARILPLLVETMVTQSRKAAEAREVRMNEVTNGDRTKGRWGL